MNKCRICELDVGFGYGVNMLTEYLTEDVGSLIASGTNLLRRDDYDPGNKEVKLGILQKDDDDRDLNLVRSTYGVCWCRMTIPSTVDYSMGMLGWWNRNELRIVYGLGGGRKWQEFFKACFGVFIIKANAYKQKAKFWHCSLVLPVPL
ncbi:hypothetical protein Tco_0567914 [Tanacetum coccineum]